jgi:hypothetical protein
MVLTRCVTYTIILLWLRLIQLQYSAKCKRTGMEAIVAYCNVITSRHSSVVIEEITNIIGMSHIRIKTAYLLEAMQTFRPFHLIGKTITNVS